MEMSTYTFEVLRTVFVELDGKPVAHVSSMNRTFVVEDYNAEDEFGQWAKDEVTGEQGHVDDENIMFLDMGRNWVCLAKEKHHKKWKRSKGVDRTEMRKEEKRLRCALLCGSAWSTEKKYVRRYRGTFDIFFGIEHRLRKEEMEEQFNKEAKERWRFAASAARITEETAGNEDRKGGDVVAIDNNLGAVVGAEEGAIGSIPGSEGTIAQAWVNVRGGLRIFAVYFWHSEGWTSGNEALMEAVLKRTRTTKYPWLIACDTDTSPEDFEKIKCM